MDQLHTHIESLVFAAKEPLSVFTIKEVVEKAFNTTFKEKKISEAVATIKAKYAQDEQVFEFTKLAGGYTFMTKPQYVNTINSYIQINNRKKLTRAMLETLAIVAYKQPVPKSEIEQIRGVNADYAMNKLLEKELIEISGRSDGPGRPLLYVTTQKFMDHFGLESITELPKIKEIEPQVDQIGEPAPNS